MNCLLFGGSGEVGSAVARALIASEICTKLTLLGRRGIDRFQNEPKVEQVIVDTSAADFESIVCEVAKGHDVAISCIGIGSGTAWMDEAKMLEVEVTMVGKYARGCRAAGIEVFELLTAVGVGEAQAHSRIKGVRVMGKKYKTVLDVGFPKLAVFKPGMIVGNVHTPKWLAAITAVVPDAIGWGNIHQDEVGRAFAAHLERRVASQQESVVAYGNKEMKALIAEG